MLNVYGTMDMPGTKGYTNASFTVSPNNVVPLTHLNQTGDVPRLWEPNVATTHVQLFTSSRLPTDTYEMTLTSGASQLAPFYLDYLTVQLPDDAPITGRVIVDDADSTQWKLTGSWKAANIPGNYLTTISQAQTPGGSATLPFVGTDITVYGTLNGNYSATKILAYFQIDDGSNHTGVASDIPNDAAYEATIRRQQKIFTTSGLANGTHTLKIVVPSSAPTDPTWYLDYAVYGQAAPVWPTPDSSPSGSSSPPAGAIAGGVVGGLVVIAALVAFLLWRRRSRRGTRVIKHEIDGDVPLDVPALGAHAATPYIGAGTPADSTSKDLLVGRRSMRKGGGRGMQQTSSPAAVARREGAGLLDDSTLQSPTSPGLPFGSAVTGSVMTSESGSSQQPRSSTQGTTVISDQSGQERNKRRRGPRRERDGGVRLASGSDDEGDDDTEEVLPPSYARYT